MYNFNNLFDYLFGFNSFLNQSEENDIEKELKDCKITTNEYKNGDRVVKEEIYEKEGFKYKRITSSYEPDQNDLKIQQLQGELDKAVKEQNFEKAVELRDQIQKLKTNE